MPFPAATLLLFGNIFWLVGVLLIDGAVAPALKMSSISRMFVLLAVLAGVYPVMFGMMDLGCYFLA